MSAVQILDAALFLSTPSARRATLFLSCLLMLAKISIHALREEGDSAARGKRQQSGHFYPRPPRGGRRSAQ